MASAALGNPNPENERDVVARVAHVNANLHAGHVRPNVVDLVVGLVLARYDAVRPEHAVRSWARKTTVLYCGMIARMMALRTDGLVLQLPSESDLKPGAAFEKLDLVKLIGGLDCLDRLLFEVRILVHARLNDDELRLVKRVLEGATVVEAGASLGLDREDAQVLWYRTTRDMALILLAESQLNEQVGLLFLDLVGDLKRATQTLVEVLGLLRLSSGKGKPLL